MATSPLNVPIPSINQLAENAARLLQQSLAQAAQTASPASLSAADLELARSNIKALAFVQAVGLHGVYRYLRDFIARQAIPIASEGAFLDGWLQTYGLTRKTAVAAAGSVICVGLVGVVLPAGALLQAVDGRQYRVTADAVFIGAGPVGSCTANVIALVPGAAGNLSGGTQLQMTSPISGIDSASQVVAITGGSDIETDAQAIYRLQQRLSAEPMGGSPADYARWALQVPGITRAWGLRNPAGPTTAGVIIMADGNPSPGLPTTGQQTAVVDYIRDPRRGPPDELFVIIPTPVSINVQLTISPDTTTIRSGVRAALADLFFREAVPGGSIPHSHLTETISSVVGEYNHQIISPTITSGSFFTVDRYDKLLVLGAVSFV